VPVQLRFAVRGMTIAASVCTPTQLPAAPLEIQRTDHDGWRTVRVVRRTPAGETETISDDHYAAPPIDLS